MERVLPEPDVRGYLQRLVGLSLLGEVNGDKQIAPILTGTGANGKSTFIEAVLFSLGDYGCPSDPDLLMSKTGNVHPTGTADLLGRRFESTSETGQGSRFDIALLKRLTGGDSLKSRFMRQDFFTFAPSHLLMMSTNHLPVIDDDSESIWRRVRVLRFDVVIPEAERDAQLGDRLRAEADAVLSWIVQGWVDYREQGLDEPPAVMLATNEYRADADVIGSFLDQCCLTGPAFSSQTRPLYEQYERWLANEGHPKISMVAFGRALDAKGYPADKNSHHRWRRGIGLKDESTGQ